MILIDDSSTDNDQAPPGFVSWDVLLAQAEGSAVNGYRWGGADAINDFVDTVYGVPSDCE